MKELVESFRFPHRTFKPKLIPSQEELKKFYNALKSQRDKALFLFYASSGLRNNEVLSLNRFTDIDFEKRRIIPKKEGNESKHVWVSFYNEEAEQELKKYLASRKDEDPRLFPICSAHVLRIFRKTRRRCGVNVTPQILREWFCSKMGELGVQDRYVDAFCGRVPNSVLARHYTDFSPGRLNKIYDKVGLTVLS